MNEKRIEHAGPELPYNNVLSDEWYRTIELTGDIEEESCSSFLHAMHRLLAENPNEMITILISSNGGTVEEAFAMYDIIRHARRTCIVRTICYGRAYSAGSLILACGSVGYRYAYPSSTAMIHGIQLHGVVMGHIKTSTLPMIQNALDDYKRFVDYFAYELKKKVENGVELSGDPAEVDDLVEELHLLMNQDTYLDAAQMIEIKLVDKMGIPQLDMIDYSESSSGEVSFEGPPLPVGYQNDATDDSKWELIETTNE